MAKQGTVAKVAMLPKCDFHPIHFPDRPAPDAQYDFRSKDGRWGYGCVVCWRRFRMHETLGTGKGQKLELYEAGK